MDLARYAVACVITEGRSIREVASSIGMSKSWVAKQLAFYRQGGYEAVGPKKRGPSTPFRQTAPEVEDAVVRWRKHLAEEGLDAGARTLAFHLCREFGERAPSVATIHRILRRRGFVTPQPQKRPRSSWIRFEASLPNERWQTDATHWTLADGSGVEIVNYIDDYSRLVVASVAFRVATAPDVVATFYKAAARYGFPTKLLSDNGCIYTAAHRGGRTKLETELITLGISFSHGRPYHPQTQGKVERYHQTLKNWLRRQRKVRTVEELQRQIDWFVRYYNEERPHQARGTTPLEAWRALDRAAPGSEGQSLTPATRVRHDKVDPVGKFTLRHGGKLYKIAVGRAHKHKRILVLVEDLDIRVLSDEGELLRRLTLDPSRRYQPL